MTSEQEIMLDQVASLLRPADREHFYHMVGARLDDGVEFAHAVVAALTNLGASAVRVETQETLQ
jgi:hypothetical protein